MTPPRLLDSFAALCFLLVGMKSCCWGVEVDRVSELDDKGLVSVQSTNPTILGCWYMLAQEDQLQEVVWVKGGKMLQSDASVDGPPDTVLVSQLELEHPVKRTDAGEYSCTVRTKAGEVSTKKYELLVIDIPQSNFLDASAVKDCIYDIIVEEPQTYPEGTAFCGIWINETSSITGKLGYWLEPPPPASASEQPGTSARTPADRYQLSYSSVRGDWTKLNHPNNLTSLSLKNAKIRMSDTPEGSFQKCFFGFFKKDGKFIKISAISTSSTELVLQPLIKCPYVALEEATVAKDGVSLLYQPSQKKDCRGRVGPVFGDKLTARVSCKYNRGKVMLRCGGDGQWQLEDSSAKQQAAEQGYMTHLEEYVSKCYNKTETETGNGTAAGLVFSGRLIIAMSFLVSLPTLL